MAEECQRCGRDTMLVDAYGDRYCPVCLDAFADPDADATPPE